jgi:hypothetical protein
MLLQLVNTLMIVLPTDIGNGKEAVGGHLVFNLLLFKMQVVEQLLLELN